MSSLAEKFLRALDQSGCNPKENSKGWSARCPAHEDRNPSLSVSEGSDGRVLVHCHTGCKIDAICDTVGLHVSDLMPDAPHELPPSTQPRKTRDKGRKRRQSTNKTAGKTYATAREAIAALDTLMARDKGKRVSYWTYLDAKEKKVAVIVRYDLPTSEGEKQQKTFRPVARHGDEWTIGGMPEPRPLYCLPHLTNAKRIFITEGEKAADAARMIGLTATTSAHGSQSPEKTDWSPLSGKECVILPDHDDAGEKYADTVAAILAKLTPPAVVKVVHLPDLPKHGDIADWLEARKDTDLNELQRQVEALVDDTDLIQIKKPINCIEQLQSFPTDALPEPVCGFVVSGAKAIGCDSSYLALPLLTALAAAIGNTRCIQLKRGWTAPAIIWTAIVGESGTSKTPAFRLVMKPFHDRQRKAFESHIEVMKQYEADLIRYDKNLSIWKRDKKTVEPPPVKPEPPQAERFIVNDITVEALTPVLKSNPRGVLLVRDELAGWIGSFDRYAGGKGGGDAAHWLSMYNGESIAVDRKSDNQRTIYVPQASVCLTGGIQPEILHRALGIEHRESGLLARLLLTCPPRKPKRWTEADIDPDAEKDLARLVDRLYDQQLFLDDTGKLQPVTLPLTPEAKTAWTDYYNQHAEEQNDLSGELSAAWSKLEECAPRLALVIHCIRWAAYDPNLQNSEVVDVESMKAGIKLAQWFKIEVRRVYARLSESDEDREQRRLTEWIHRQGGSVTARKVQQRQRQYRAAHEAEAALDALSKAGCGNWHNVPSGPEGGRPTRVFRLSTASTSTKRSKTRDSEGFVDVNSVAASNTQSEDDWGEL